MTTIIDARHPIGLPEDSDKALPNEIQWMPPGRHNISARKNGRPARLSVEVDAATAAAVSGDFAQLVQSGKSPYIDFNHDSGAASARVKGIRWGGDDPKAGGIRLIIDSWTDRGAQAVKSKEFTHFSPTFRVDPKTGRIVGTTANMGGLVNEPAFTSISPVTAKENEQDMNKLLTALVAAKLIQSPDLSDDEAVTQFTAAFAPYSGAKAELDTTKAELTTVKAKVAETEKQRATDLVAAAAAEGRIPAKDEASKNFWVTAIITAGATAEAALKALPVNPVLAQVVKVEAGAADVAAEKDLIKKREEKISTYRASRPNASFDDAWTACSAESPELFK